MLPALKSYFPGIVSYTQFLSYLPRLLPELMCLMSMQCMKSEKSGIYYIDSKPLEVCHIKREHSNKVFDGYARKGKSSTGWFLGLKLHMLINHKGEIMRYMFTSANVADNNEEVLKYMLEGMKGTCYGDKGYITKLFEYFYNNGLHLFKKSKKNMKQLLCSLKDAVYIRKRGIIESLFDIITSVLDIEHTRHRKADNAFAHILAGLIAYCFLDKKPSLKQDFRLLQTF